MGWGKERALILDVLAAQTSDLRSNSQHLHTNLGTRLRVLERWLRGQDCMLTFTKDLGLVLSTHRDSNSEPS